MNSVSFLANQASYSSVSSVKKSVKPKYSNVLPADTVSFTSRVTNERIANELLSSNSSSWKSPWGNNKYTQAKVLKHPLYGKVKVGVTIRKRRDYDYDIDKRYLKAFIEIPKLKSHQSTNKRDNPIFELAEKLVGTSFVNGLQAQADLNKEISERKGLKILANL